MFEKLVIKNFQRHSHLEIDLDEKVTTIVGPSDTGKSAVIRSLRWLCQNSPSGIEFLKNGTPSVSVKLTVDGKEIERTKSASNNAYSIDGKELKAFGQGVPAAVADVLNVDDINFQAQLDPPYWLTLTSGEVSRQLNALIDLSIIDETMKNINRAQSRARVELELAEEKAKSKEQQLEEMQWVGECEVDFGVVQAADKLLGEKKIDLEDLKILDKEILGASIDATQARSKLSAVAEVGKLAAHIRTQQQVLDGVAGVLSTVKSLEAALQFRSVSTEAVDSAAEALKTQTSTLQSLLRIRNEYRASAPLVKMKNVPDDLNWVEQERIRFSGLRDELSSLKGVLDSIVDKERHTRMAWVAVNEADDELQEKTRGQICPVCGKFGL